MSLRELHIALSIARARYGARYVLMTTTTYADTHIPLEREYNGDKWRYILSLNSTSYHGIDAQKPTRIVPSQTKLLLFVNISRAGVLEQGRENLNSWSHFESRF